MSHLIVYCGQLFFAGCAVFAAHRALTGGARHFAVGLALLALGAGSWWSGVLPLVAGMPLAFAGVVVLVSALDARPGPRPARLLSYAGDSTYGLYLWHVPIQIAVFLIAPSSAAVESWARSPWWLAAFLALAIAVSRVSYLLIERPLRERIRRFGEVRTVDAPVAAP